MRKLVALVLVCAMTLTAGGCVYSNQQLYEQAQLCLGCEDYESAASIFSQLGEYKDSAEYALYAQALLAWQSGNLALARRTLEEIDPFKSSSRYLRYMDAMDNAQSGHLEEALIGFSSLGAFKDSEAQAEEVQGLIQKSTLEKARSLMASRDYENAISILKSYAGNPEADSIINSCISALAQKTYNEADSYYRRGLYAEAYQAFSALGDTLDASHRAQQSLEALFLGYDEAFDDITLAGYPDAMAQYTAMSALPAARARLEQLKQTYGLRIQLMEESASHPILAYGSYAYGDSGSEAPVLWQVLRVEGTKAVLLCCSVLDAMPFASCTDLSITTCDTEAPALLRLSIPSTAYLSDLSATLLQASATPYAQAQGAAVDEARVGWWWLEDTLPDGHQAIVWYDGTVPTDGKDQHDPTGGVRPLLVLDLEDLPIQHGCGTADDPYRI